MNVSPEYLHAVRGAFAWAHIWAHPDVLIRVDEEDHASPFTHVLGYHWPRVPLRVTVSCPYGRPDPRGPDAGESVHITYDPRGRMVRGRPPAEVGAVVPLDLTAGELEQHALATRMRLDRELARGYRAVQSSVPAPDHIARERPALPQHAGGRYLDTDVEAWWVDGHDDVGELIRYRRRSMEGRPTVRVSIGPVPEDDVEERPALTRWASTHRTAGSIAGELIVRHGWPQTSTHVWVDEEGEVEPFEYPELVEVLDGEIVADRVDLSPLQDLADGGLTVWDLDG